MNLQQLKKELSKNPDFVKEYKKFDLGFEIYRFFTILKSKMLKLLEKLSNK